MLRERLGRALTTNRAATDPRSDDPRLLGRTYAIPFDQVWTACLVLVERPRHWTLLQANDLDGYLSVECQTPVFKFIDDFEIRIGLDEHAMTRVDVESQSRKGRGDLGSNARRIGRFLRRLDRLLDAAEGAILDPTHLETWSAEAG